MINDNYFDASLLIGDSNIAMQMPREKFIKLSFEDKTGMLIAKITNEALEDNKINFLKLTDKYKFAAIAFFHHWTAVLVSVYLKKSGRNLDSEWSAKSFLGFFSLNNNFDSKYLSEQYSITNKQVVEFFEDAKINERASEITETYSTLICSYVQNKGLDPKKEINYREIFKHQLQACFDMLVPE